MLAIKKGMLFRYKREIWAENVATPVHYYNPSTVVLALEDAQDDFNFMHITVMVEDKVFTRIFYVKDIEVI
jgi:hypothetical protein